MLRWTFVFTLLFYSVFIHSSSLQPVKEPLPICCSIGFPRSLGNPFLGVPPIRWLGLQTYCFFLNFQTKKQKLFPSPVPAETLGVPTVSASLRARRYSFRAGAKVW